MNAQLIQIGVSILTLLVTIVYVALTYQLLHKPFHTFLSIKLHADSIVIKNIGNHPVVISSIKYLDAVNYRNLLTDTSSILIEPTTVKKKVYIEAHQEYEYKVANLLFVQFPIKIKWKLVTNKTLNTCVKYDNHEDVEISFTNYLLHRIKYTTSFYKDWLKLYWKNDRSFKKYLILFLVKENKSFKFKDELRMHLEIRSHHFDDLFRSLVDKGYISKDEDVYVLSSKGEKFLQRKKRYREKCTQFFSKKDIS